MDALLFQILVVTPIKVRSATNLDYDLILITNSCNLDIPFLGLAPLNGTFELLKFPQMTSNSSKSFAILNLEVKFPYVPYELQKGMMEIMIDSAQQVSK